MPCCLFATDAEVDEDSEQYDCQNCTVADALDELQADQHNAEAWRLYRSVISRFIVDAHAIGTALAKLTEAHSVEDFQELIDRLALIYDTLHPPKQEPTS